MAHILRRVRKDRDTPKDSPARSVRGNARRVGLPTHLHIAPELPPAPEEMAVQKRNPDFPPPDRHLRIPYRPGRSHAPQEGQRTSPPETPEPHFQQGSLSNSASSGADSAPSAHAQR